MTSNKKPYVLYECKDCDLSFLVEEQRKKYNIQYARFIFCPSCGENYYTEKITRMYMQRPVSHRRNWTQNENEIIETGVNAGYTARQIAESLDGRTVGSVYKQVQRLRKEGVEI